MVVDRDRHAGRRGAGRPRLTRRPLIVTNRGDHTADWLIIELQARTAEFVRFNTEDYPVEASVTWRSAGDRVLRVRGREYPLRCFPSVWYRRPVAPRLPNDTSPALGEWAIGEARDALDGLWRTHDALWVNHPDRNRLASSKQEQLETAGRLGLEIPESIVTGIGTEAYQFAADHPRGIVCKPLRWGRVPTPQGERLFFTSRLTAEQLEEIDRVGPEPYLFQALVEKQYDVRVTVIGNEPFAARIESQVDDDAEIDWRRQGARLVHRSEELPDDVAERCVQLVRHYGLHFGAIDLARRPDGGFTFFEINPNGQWAWVEQLTGLPLRSRLADLLLGPC